jgi:hypothetical protein
MDEKTEELRDIFMDVAEDGTVTESQAAERGSLADTDEADVADRVAAVVERMRDRYDFATDLPTADLVTVVRGFYDGDDDAAIADAIDGDPATVFAARMDLHLLADADTEFGFDLDAFRDRLDAEGPDSETLATEFDTDPETAARARRVLATKVAVRRVSHRFQSEFEDAIPDAALAVHLTAAAREDGLEEAAEDIETDTKL